MNGGHDILEKASSTETLKHPEVDLGAASRHTYVGDYPIVHLTYEQKESECLRREFQKYFDVEIEYVDLDSAFVTVKDSLVKLANETQWVPRNWVYS